MKKIATYLFLSILSPALTFATQNSSNNKNSEIKVNNFSPIFKKITIDSMNNLIDRLNEEDINLKTAGIAFDFDDTLAHRVVKFPTLTEDVLFNSEITRDRAEKFYKLIEKFQIIDDPIPQNQIEYEQYLKKGMTITRNKVLAAAL
ncbi:MAG: hypothetical protein Q8K37_04795, partial [Alphaproteobacteria bacterium]|nr:hypothetical protein [Alphaproteobacteria bacterium]